MGNASTRVLLRGRPNVVTVLAVGGGGGGGDDGDIGDICDKVSGRELVIF